MGISKLKLAELKLNWGFENTTCGIGLTGFCLFFGFCFGLPFSLGMALGQGRWKSLEINPNLELSVGAKKGKKLSNYTQEGDKVEFVH